MNKELSVHELNNLIDSGKEVEIYEIVKDFKKIIEIDGLSCKDFTESLKIEFLNNYSHTTGLLEIKTNGTHYIKNRNITISKCYEFNLDIKFKLEHDLYWNDENKFNEVNNEQITIV